MGLGYVGCVSAGCLSYNGHKIIGVDVNEQKAALINEGKPTVIEKDLEELIYNARKSNKLEAVTDSYYAVLNTDITIICVGTPGNDNGRLNLDYIYNVAAETGRALKEKGDFHIIAIRSTVPPGTCKKIAGIIEDQSGKKLNADFAIVSNPEFLREGTAVSDYYNPPYTLLGSESSRALGMMEEIYKNINAPVYRTEIEVAEIIKYINNSFHALKVTFGNEVGNICKALGIDSHKVMDLVCKDTKLNISPYYLKPGFAYGGSCLPKDLNALVRLSRDMDLDVPVLESISKSNELQKKILVNKIIKEGRKNIGILGLSFKPGTDDLRESPIVEIIEILIGKGFNVRIYDKNVNLSRLMGSNKSYIDTKLPHISKLLADKQKVIDESELLVVSNKENEFKPLFNFVSREEYLLKEKKVIDLVRIAEQVNKELDYEGISW